MSRGRLEVERVIAEFVRRLSRKIRLSRVILFGSTARGDRLRQSDVDLIIVSDDFKGMPLNERFRLVYSEWPPEIDADLIPLTEEEFHRALKTSVVLRDAMRYWKEIRISAEKCEDKT